MRTNPQIELAREFLSTTGANLFLTGRAGTGKTTFLRSVVESINKRVVVAAPTGVAAINARGVTLHSLFQLPFGPNVPGVKRMDFAMRKMGAKKLALIRSIELLVIDEISMVRCDLLDAIDETLRQVRRSEAPFGGVQLLMIGDIEQLSPICRDEDWQLLHEHYNSPYFFDSHVLKRCSYITITLTEIFRQSDSSFTELLNAVRENNISQAVVDKLNSRYIPNFEPRERDGYITLTTHNNTANNINSRELKQLPSPSHLFEAKVKGEYPEGAYPNDSSLELKVGAQVIFIKNDISTEKLYYNGLIGRIELVEGEQVSVRPNNGGELITLSRVEWENIEYKLSAETGEIEESIKGTFSQIPLRCAWAITIHKSQGLSFDRAIIDAGNSFAHGQVYVALSRCRTFEGMVLRSPLSFGSVIRDNSVEGFTQEVSSQDIGEEELQQHRKEYFTSLLAEVFNFENLNRNTSNLTSLLSAALYIEYPQLCQSLRSTTISINDEMQRVGASFTTQLKRAIHQSEDFATDSYIAERLSKAATYFEERLTPLSKLIEEATQVRSDAKELSKRLNKLVSESREECAIKLCALKLCAQRFSCEEYLKEKYAIIATPDSAPTAKKSKPKVTSDITNVELYEALVAWRTERARESEKPAYTILTNRSLLEIQSSLPTTIEELKAISGIGPAKLKNYGDDIINIVEEFYHE